MLHELKIRPDFADAVIAGEKNFELRPNDRGFQRGDEIRFRVFDRDGIYYEHEIQRHFYVITYVLNGWGLENGFVAFEIRREDE